MGHSLEIFSNIDDLAIELEALAASTNSVEFKFSVCCT